MSKIIDLVEKHFGIDNSFSANEFSDVTGINSKVCSMQLRRLANVESLGSFLVMGSYRYYLRTKEEVQKKRIETNEMIDKYDLKQPKYKIN